MLVVPEFQCLRYLHTVGVADDDVQAAVFVGGVGFVARIDDRAFEGGLQADFGVDVVGALAELVARNLAVLGQSLRGRSRRRSGG